MANSVDPDQTAPRSSLIWVYTVCLCILSDTLVYEILGHLPKATQEEIHLKQ